MTSFSSIYKFSSCKNTLCSHHLLKTLRFYLAIALLTLSYVLFPYALTASQSFCAFNPLKIHTEIFLWYTVAFTMGYCVDGDMAINQEAPHLRTDYMLQTFHHYISSDLVVIWLMGSIAAALRQLGEQCLNEPSLLPVSFESDCVGLSNLSKTDNRKLNSTFLIPKSTRY